VIVAVHADNAASWRALEKAGLTRVGSGEIAPDNPIDDRRHHVYRIDRPAQVIRPAGYGDPVHRRSRRVPKCNHRADGDRGGRAGGRTAPHRRRMPTRGLHREDDEQVADQFDVSVELARWCMNTTGARVIAQRSAKRRNG
jgi:hypothetical protein